jgi:hypothetical protein
MWVGQIVWHILRKWSATIATAFYAGFLGQKLMKLSEEKVWKNIQGTSPGLF